MFSFFVSCLALPYPHVSTVEITLQAVQGQSRARLQSLEFPRKASAAGTNHEHWIRGQRELDVWCAQCCAGVPSMRKKEVIVQQPMGTISGQGPPGAGAPARYANMDPERGTVPRPRGRAY